MTINDSIFREYDIRGVWNKDINKEFCVDLGKAFAVYLKEKTKKDNLIVSVGYDARLSSQEAFLGLSEGLNKEGVDVVNLKLVPTPVQYFSLFKLSLDGGIMITASHNPKEYNGFKLSLNKETLYGSQIQQVKEIMKNLDRYKTQNSKYGTVKEYDILKDYKNYILEQFGYLKDYKNKPSAVLDGGNGAGGFVGFEIIKELGFDVKGLFIEPDGNFPNHHPDPTIKENLKVLIDTVKNEEYDVGIGYDGDADRIGVVLKNEEMLYGDELLLLFAQDVIKNNKNAKIISEVKCSKVLFDGIEKAGGKAIMYKAGHSLIKSKMKEEKALLAGEMSGHIFFADRYFGYDDAIYASIRLLEILTKEKIDLVEWKNRLPKTFNTPEIRVECPDDKKKTTVDRFIKYLENNREKLNIININTIDGARFETQNGWGLVRASNTQPSLVLRFEANSLDNLDNLKQTTMDALNNFLD